MMEGFVYGRKVPGQVVEPVKPVVPVVQEEVKVVKEKPMGFFDKAIISKELFAEINLFIPQVLGFAISIFAGLFAILLVRLTTSGISTIIQPIVDEATFVNITSQLNFINTLTLVGVIVPILVYGAFLGFKFMVMMPKKDREIVIRRFKSRALMFSIERVKTKMLFNPKDKKTEVLITDPSKHYDYLNGRPIVVLGEEERTNVSLMDDLDTSGKGRDTDSMVGNAVHTGYEIAREQLAQRDDKQKIILILLIVILAAIALVGFGVMKSPDAVIAGVSKLLGSAAQVAPAALVKVI